MSQHESAPKRQFNRFVRFCTAYPCVLNTQTETTLCATCSTKGHVYALHSEAGDANQNIGSRPGNSQDVTTNFIRYSRSSFKASCNFYRAMLCIRGTSHGSVSVRPSVCLSVTSRSSTKTAKRRITQTTPHDSPGTLVFSRQRSPRNSTGSHPTRAPNAGEVGQNRRLSTNSWLYLENGTR